MSWRLLVHHHSNSSRQNIFLHRTQWKQKIISETIPHPKQKLQCKQVDTVLSTRQFSYLYQSYNENKSIHYWTEDSKTQSPNHSSQTKTTWEEDISDMEQKKILLSISVLQCKQVINYSKTQSKKSCLNFEEE